MRRGKRRVTVTGKMFLQAREDKYWTTWAERRVAHVQRIRDVVVGDPCLACPGANMGRVPNRAQS